MAPSSIITNVTRSRVAAAALAGLLFGIFVGYLGPHHERQAIAQAAR